mgnify:CR=1 FL=1|tara:strand:- start:70 stop:258 length:189 start_codon:yes stop_codon:yes gene_type:complete
MILPVLSLEKQELISLCAVCISDRSGGQMALLIIISALILLGVGNWAWKKHLLNKKQRSQQK